MKGAKTVALSIQPAERSDVKHIYCPACGEKLRGVGIAKDSRIFGLSFKCRKCGKLWSVKTE